MFKDHYKKTDITQEENVCHECPLIP